MILFWLNEWFNTTECIIFDIGNIFLRFLWQIFFFFFLINSLTNLFSPRWLFEWVIGHHYFRSDSVLQDWDFLASIKGLLDLDDFGLNIRTDGKYYKVYNPCKRPKIRILSTKSKPLLLFLFFFFFFCRKTVTFSLIYFGSNNQTI